MPELILSVKRSQFRKDDGHAELADADFRTIRGSIITRDRNICQFCEFRAGKFQEVHHVDGDHHNNDKSNLITVCSLCHACHHLGFAGMNGGASLVWLPEIKQVTLNAMLRAAYVLERRSKPEDVWQGFVRKFLSFMASRRDLVKERLGDSSAVLLGNSLQTASESDYARRSESLEGIRLWVHPGSKMLQREVIDYWAMELYDALLLQEDWKEALCRVGA